MAQTKTNARVHVLHKLLCFYLEIDRAVYRVEVSGNWVSDVEIPRWAIIKFSSLHVSPVGISIEYPPGVNISVPPTPIMYGTVRVRTSRDLSHVFTV